MRRTQALVQVMAELVADPHTVHWGYNLMTSTGLDSGTVYPILGRLRKLGWVTSEWEPTSNVVGPPRRYYVVTERGLAEMRTIVADETTTT